MSKKNNTFKKLITGFLLRNTKIDIFILFILPIINAIFNTYFFTKYIGLVIKNLLDNNLIEAKYALFKIIGVIMFLQILRYWQRTVLSKFLSKVNYFIKEETFKIFTHLSVNQVGSNTERVYKLSNDIIDTINIIFSFLYRPFCSLLIGIVTMILINKTLGKIFVIFVIALKFIIKKPMINTYNLERQKKINNQFVEDISRNFFLEKLLNLRDFTRSLFKEKLSIENTLMQKQYNSLAITGLYCNLLCEISCCTLLLVSLFLNIPINVKISSLNLIDRFFSDFNDIPDKIVPLLNNIGKIQENLLIFNENIEKDKSKFEDQIKSIKIKNISYKYNQQDVISKLSVDLKVGLYQIKGNSGSGKSTLLKLITGILTPNNGDIYINNVYNLKDYNIMHSISYLCQFDYTYNRTVKENIVMNQNINNISNEIFTYNMENILDNFCGINGQNISGGQNRRLSFLRMLNFQKQGNLIILDEPFNGLDNKLINNILDYIKNNLSNNIIIVIDHTNALQDIPYTTLSI